jgi:hypothetical protein
MLITSDAKRTSGSAQSLEGLTPWHVDANRYAGASLVSPVFVSCRRVAETVTGRSELMVSGKRNAYTAQVMINSPSVTSFISAGRGKIDYTVYGFESSDPISYQTNSPRVAHDREDFETLCFEGWATVSEDFVSAGLSTAVAALRDVVSAIRNRSPLQLSPRVEALINQAVLAHGTPDDIQAWARRLAEDVRDLSD